MAEGSEVAAAPHYGLLAVGIALLLSPLVFIVAAPDQVEQAGFFLRVSAALGGGLIGAFIPGLLNVDLPYAKAGGALAVFLLIYGVNPPQIAQSLLGSLKGEANAWVDTAKKARESGAVAQGRPLPHGVAGRRSAFERAWLNARQMEKESLEPKLAYEALSLTYRVYRVQEIQSERKPEASKWADISIAYFEAIDHTAYLVEALLDKAALYLELSQIEHTDPESWKEIAKQGDTLLSRAYALSQVDQQPDVLRLWSRFFYNLSRPRSGNLTEKWDNNYLLQSLEKIELAHKLEPTNIKNATQLARATQKAAANPPHDSDPAWTKKLRDVHTQLVTAWGANNEKRKTPADRIPTLNILGVLTLDVVHREWEESLLNNELESGSDLADELEMTGIKAQREAVTLLPNTEWKEDYDFDMYYDLARMQAVKCRIAVTGHLPNATPICREIAENMKAAKLNASAIQLNSARQAMVSDPTLNLIPEPYREELYRLLESSAI